MMPRNVRLMCFALILFHFGVSQSKVHKLNLEHAMKLSRLRVKATPHLDVQVVVKPGSSLATVSKVNITAKLGNTNDTIVLKCGPKINEQVAHLLNLMWGQARFGDPVATLKIMRRSVNQVSKGHKMGMKRAKLTGRHPYVDAILTVQPSHAASTGELFKYEYRCGVAVSAKKTIDWADAYFFWRAARNKTATNSFSVSDLPEVWREIKVSVSNLSNGTVYPEFASALQGSSQHSHHGMNTDPTAPHHKMNKKLMILAAGVPSGLLVLVVIGLAVRHRRKTAPQRKIQQYVSVRRGTIKTYAKDQLVPDMPDDLWAAGSPAGGRAGSQRAAAPAAPTAPVAPAAPTTPARTSPVLSPGEKSELNDPSASSFGSYANNLRQDDYANLAAASNSYSSTSYAEEAYDEAQPFALAL